MDDRLASQIERWGLRFETEPQVTPFLYQIRAQFPQADEDTVREASDRLRLVATLRGRLTSVSPEFAQIIYETNRSERGEPAEFQMSATVLFEHSEDPFTGETEPDEYRILEVTYRPGMTLQEYRAAVDDAVDAWRRNYEFERRGITLSVYNYFGFVRG